MEFGGRRTTFPHPNSGGRSTGIGMGMTPSMNSNDCSSVDGPPAGAECIVREQDRFMPIANVIRIMRKILPSHAKISDDAKETIQECVSEFISFITGEANERCQREQRKTITAEDVLWAMSKLGFDDYIEPLTLYLHRHRQFDCGDQKGSFKPADQFGKRAVEPFPVTLPVSPTVYGAPALPPPPPSFGHHHRPPTGFFFPTPASPVNGLSTTDNHSSNGTPSSSIQKQDSSSNA